LKQWIHYVKNADFSDVKVFLVTSVPGKHYPESAGSHVHHVGHLLSRHCTLPAKSGPDTEGPLSWGVIAQASSIGSLGKSPADWLRGTLLRSHLGSQKHATGVELERHPQRDLPHGRERHERVLRPESGGCLPYSKQTNEKQRWFQTYLQ
jgi:tyrosyl-DNA phosphodiesterase-1